VLQLSSVAAFAARAGRLTRAPEPPRRPLRRGHGQRGAALHGLPLAPGLQRRLAAASVLTAVAPSLQAGHGLLGDAASSATTHPPPWGQGPYGMHAHLAPIWPAWRREARPSATRAAAWAARVRRCRRTGMLARRPPCRPRGRGRRALPRRAAAPARRARAAPRPRWPTPAALPPRGSPISAQRRGWSASPRAQARRTWSCARS
jgi:hypothetical protein